LESWSQPGRGLREYFRRVADACGSGEAFSVEVERPLTGYVPIEGGLPEVDVALVWHERTGWRAVLEPPSTIQKSGRPPLATPLTSARSGPSACFELCSPTNNDLITLSYLNSSVCPPPEEVAEFAANPGGGVTTPVTTTEDVFELLSDYAVVRMRPIAG
jgi:hypothetical protein